MLRQIRPARGQEPADPIEIRLYAAAVVNYHHAVLSDLAGWASATITCGTECTSRSNELPTPLTQGLQQVHEEEDFELMAQVMPGDSGITAENMAGYTARSCRKGRASWSEGRLGCW